MGNCFGSRAQAVLPETTQSPHPTSMPSVASSSQGGTRKPAHVTTPSDDDVMSSTPSLKPATRARVQSQNAASSQRRHRDDGEDHLLLSSRVDVFTSQNTDRQEMRSPQYPSSETGSTQRARSVSMGIALQGAPSRSSSRRNRAVSTTLHGNGHQRTSTKSMSGVSSATSQMPPGRQGVRPRFPSALQSLLPNDFRYTVRPLFYQTLLLLYLRPQIQNSRCGKSESCPSHKP